MIAPHLSATTSSVRQKYRYLPGTRFELPGSDGKLAQSDNAKTHNQKEVAWGTFSAKSVREQT